jgi:hypothetical protein
MKQLMKTVIMKIFLTVLAFLTADIFILAQDAGSGSSSTVTTTHTETQTWYAQPWVWIVGAAIFILLLVAIVGGNKRSDVTVTKTTTERSDI